MLKFKNLNLNPKGRKTGDCSVRALAGVLGITYDDALDLQIQEVKKSYYDSSSRQTMERVLKKYGYTKKAQPKYNGNKYQVREMDKWLSKKELENGVVVNVRHHYVFIKDDYYQDICDTGRMTVGNYYSKEN